MGLAGSVHCFAMCGASSAAVVRVCSVDRGHGALLGFHVGRILGYAAAGAVVSTVVMSLAWLGQYAPVLKPVWVMMHMAAFGVGIWLLVAGRQPRWLERLGRAASGEQSSEKIKSQSWRRVHWGYVKSTLAGSAWFALPCGLLQSALMVASLASSPFGGAVVMAVFSVASAPGLLAGPLWANWLFNRCIQAEHIVPWAVRLSGFALACASVWALGHDVLRQVVAYCFS